MSLALLDPVSGPLGAPPTDTLHALVLARAAHRPEAVAVRLGDETLSYGDLAARSARLAARLRHLGVAPGTLVGLLVDRSLEMVVGILGVLRAGGAYVPLDPDYPAERLGFMWRDCGAHVLLAEERLLRSGGGAVAGESGRVVLLDRPGAAAPSAAGSEAPWEGGAGPDDLAYVIYTSGSMGKPKGVMIEHRGAVNVIRENARLLRVGERSKVLQLASLSFDASVLEIFTALATGAELVLTGRETLLSGEALGEELRRRGITALAIPPSLLDKVPEGIDLPRLTSIVVGGETCSAATARRWAPGRRFFNAYAPTEATIYVTAHRCRLPDASTGGGGPPIGRAIAGGEVHVLDPALVPVTDGEAGELCLGGVGLARGYLRRPALTAGSFVPDPLAEAPGRRLYRSGDLGTRLPGGDLVFLGRADFQVKVRGVRIELGEIESALTGLPTVQSAVVEARDGAAGDKRLVAYAVPRAGEEPTASDLWDALAAVLPAALVPQSFVLLPELPRTPTGKVDRRALPDPGGERPELATGYAPPRTPVEERLAALWGELLGLDRVGIHDDLFALGGHSLVASQIASRVRRDLGRELPLVEVFERPTVAGLAGYLEGEAGGAEEEPELPAIEPLPPEERRKPLPVTFPQERVWFLLQLAPGAIAYNFQFTIRFRGALHAPALARALSEVVRRHEVLRTTFPEVDGRPVQRVRDPFPVAPPVIDLAALPAAAREAEAGRLVGRLIEHPFDVERLPLFRTHLLRLAAEDHLFLQVEHHFVHDGWSLAVYLRELQELYRAYRRPGGEGAPSPLPELAVQYGDFAVWQRRLLDGELFRRQLAYWSGQLGGSPPLLELPADRPRPRVHGFRGGALRVDLPPTLYEATRAFGPRHGATLFMTMLAAFDALLYRYTGQEDLVIGSGVGNRRHREVEDLVGMVVNTVVLRTRLAGDLRFRELLEGVRRTTLEAHEHQDMPFERLVQELQPDRDLSRNPIFQVLFSFHDAPVPDLDLPGLSAELFEPHNGSAKAELNVVSKPLAEQRVGRRRTGREALTLVWEYSAEIFDRATVERMWGHYRTLLAGAVEDPDRPLAALPLVSAAEAHQLLEEWNDTAVAYPRERSIPELFSEQAARRREAIAVRQGERWWSYGELEARSERIASRLAGLGVGPEVLVGLAAERSPELVAGLLGILKAGGAYLPLDPTYPPERLAFMLEDGRVPVLLAANGSPAELPARARERAGTRGVPLGEALAAGEEGTSPARARSGPRSLAYVLYTSGSTGRPKGVAVEHRSVVRLVRGASFAALGEEEVFLQLAPVPFDASTLEIWGALLNGGRLEVFPPGAPSLEELGRELESSRVTILWLTAGLFHRMVEEELPRLAGVRQLLAGGDVLSVPHVERTLAALGAGQTLVNGYGPTEGTTFTCCRGMAAGAAVARESVPIGRPVSSTRIYLAAPGPGLGVARAPEPLPVGVAGELYVGGDGVARGYLARPALTAERFVPDPFSPRAGGRLYRTGDLARWLPGGEVEFLGRIDRQVKLRGFRIEPGEIESVLAGHPAVRTAAVVVREDRPGDRRLVAYAVAADEGAADPAALRAYLAERLPGYMVPSSWVTLEELPLDPNGKVDRRALLEREPRTEAAGGRRAASVPPRGPVEELVAGIWSEVLGRAPVGAHEDFFELGGHSLAATSVASRLRRVFGVEVPLRSLFEEPTVAGLAARVEALRQEASQPVAPPIRRRPRDRDLPASFAQERMWFLDRLGTGGVAYNVAGPVRVRGRLDPASLAGALGDLEARHEGLRTVFRAAGSHRAGAQVLQVVLPPARRSPPVVDLGRLETAAREEELGRLAAAGVLRPFDLARLPLWRFPLVRLDPADHALLVTAHHAVTDGWSMGVFYRELWELYGARTAGRRPRLPELPVQYADFAAWQRRWLSGAVLERQLAFWRAELAGAPAVLELPTDRPRPAVLGFRGDRRERRLPTDLSLRLRALARDHGASLFMVLLAAFQTLLARLAGQTDVTVGVPVANRNREEIEGLVGFFVNALVLRADLSGDPPFADLLPETRRRTLAAYAHQDLPFEKLVEALRPKRELSHTPLFQVALNFHDTRQLDVPLPEGVDLELAPLTPRWRTAKFDLVLDALPDSAGLRLRLEHSLQLFDGSTAARLLRHLETLLDEAAAHPARRLSALGLLGPAERHQVLAEWNDTAAADLVDPAAALLHAPFEGRAAERPDAVAVVAGGREHLSYGELERRAGALARRLAASGVGPGTLVGVHLGRGPAMAAAVLGVAKAGGAYVPLETGWPPERIRWIVAERRVRHLVTETSRLGAASALGETLERVVCADEDVPEAPGGRRPTPAGPGDLAYVIFTSGSTGKPKGVMVRHRPAAHLVSWVNRTFGVGPDDRLLFVTALSFDLSVYDLFGTLAAGGTVRLATDEELADPVRQVEVLAAERITFWDSAPAALQRLAPLFPAGEGEPEGRAGTAALRLVFLSGDWVPLTLPGRVRRSFPGARVVALGGATEATVWSNSFPVEEVSESWASIPYGRPIANARYHVLDRRLAPCPVGAAGDLYITGGCLSSGYAGSPAQTAESYLPHPFAGGAGGRPGAVLYRTGDRARYFPDGNLEFLGRLDTQVKVRGFRIELGEIEAVLSEHPGVWEAVVLAREDSPGDRRLAAYWIPADGEEGPGPPELRRWAAGRLPEYMVPVAWIERRSWPLSPTGKLDRRALPAPGGEAGAASGRETPSTPPATALERTLAAVWREVLGVPSVARDANFFDLGGHSLLVARVHERLERTLRREIPMVELFRNPTVATLAAALDEGGVEAPAEEERPRRRAAGAGAVAVVGMAGRFPGARDVDELWRNLRAGVESIRFFADDELEEAGFDPAELRDPSLVKARAVLDDPDLFDAPFFGYSPREAEAIDPQQRLFLECAWQALEDAGHAPPANGRGARVGVFGGGSASDYLRRVEAHPELPRLLGPYQVAISNLPDYLPTRVSYKLRLTGPSVAVQTACSTSLVAVHLACRSLLAGECDLALAGGASLRGRQVTPYRYVEGGISSPDGHVRAFDAGARGVVGGSGVGVVALRRLEDALADGDAIRAVIRGTAINNDGGLKAGFTAPSAEGQAEAIREALTAAGVDPATVGYVEAHGTATPLGDPIEIEGLTRAFGGAAGSGKTCALGSVKTNIGHLDAAAGIAGLIKAVLALEHREIPPSLHFETPNPAIDFAAGPFFVADRLLPWHAGTHPRRAGVSSFGIGGTNAHAVLEEAPAPEKDGSAGAAPAGGRSAELLVLSARSEAALERSTAELARHLRERPEVPPADAAWTLQAGRRAFPWRRAVVAPSRMGRGGEAAAALETLDRRLSRTGLAPDEGPRVAFLFPGQGVQFPGMGEALYREEPVFRAALDRCAEVLEPELGADPREFLFPAAGTPREEAEERLARTEVTQPVLFAVEHALGELWASWGVEPAALLGHSLGEYAAAARAGVFALEDALRLVAARGRLMGSRPGGAMLGVRLSEEGLAPYLEADGSLALAAVNAPDACAVSGPAVAVAALRERLEAAEVGCRPLHASHAFHSLRMDPVVEPFRELVARVELRPPRTPFLSNLTGTWITAEEATDPGYWARQLRSPVRFADGLAALVGGAEESAAGWALVEVGPGRTLTTLARRHPAAAGARALVSSARHPRQEGTDLDRVLSALGSLWVAGVEVDWAAHHGGRRRRRVRLPTYPFERRSYWVGDDLPRRAGEPAPAAPEPAGPTEAGAPSAAEAAVARAFRDLLGAEADGREADFFELGGSSLLALQLTGRLRELSGVELPSDALLQGSTVGELAALIEERRGAAAAGEAPAAASCLVPLRRTGSRRPLFVVHQVGGHVYSFRSLVNALAADQPVYGLRSPGLEAGEETLPTVEAMAAHYLELVRGVQPRGPYRLGGASMGGMVAFEMAGRLLDEGEEVEFLTLMDTPCGDQMPPKPEDDAVLVAGAFAGLANLDPEELRALEPDERLRVGLERARESGRLGEGFDLAQARRLVRVLSANVEALYGYQPRPYPGRMVLFRARELRPGQIHRPERAWVCLAEGGIDVTFVPGDHETMHEPPGAAAMAAHLEPLLAAAPSPERGR